MQIKYSLEEIDDVAKRLASCMNTRLYLFDGFLGVGKTTLAKAIGKHLGVVEKMQSPSYAIINEHLLVNQEKLYHVDLYRIKKIEELDGLGLEEIINTSICLVEWPRYYTYFDSYPLLYINLSIDAYETDARQLSCSTVLPSM